MGDMADFALEDVAAEEHARDEYVNGDMSMQEAFERGFLDPMGVEQEGIQDAWDRSEILTARGIDKELERWTDKLTIATHTPESTKLATRQLDEIAIESLKNDCPTCNWCRTLMTPRSGRYGKFYFCSNGCEKQKTVSDKYWQSVKR